MPQVVCSCSLLSGMSGERAFQLGLQYSVHGTRKTDGRLGPVARWAKRGTSSAQGVIGSSPYDHMPQS